MSENKKQNLIKIIIGVVLAAAAGGGADAAGIEMPDPAQFERLGIFGSLILIAYLQTVVVPLLKRGVVKLEALPAPAVAVPELAETVVEEQAVPVPVKRVATAPHLRAIKPHKDPV